MYYFLISLFNGLDKPRNSKRGNKKEKTNVYDTASELYNDLLEIYFYKYKALMY